VRLTADGADHHSEYLARTVAALTPEGRRRVDELLEQLMGLVPNHPWLVEFARTREAEADQGRIGDPAGPDPVTMLTVEELDRLVSGFKTIRDEEPLDDVGDWANAVIALLEDEARRRA
jgi:hypothetical protein